MIDLSKNRIEGKIKITDLTTGETILEKKNSIHYENMSITLARAIAGLQEGHIAEMHFGNGASVVGSTGGISYFPPNVTGGDADLYNPTFFKVVNSDSPLNTDPTQNKMSVRHVSNTTYSDVIIQATLDFNEPSGQSAFDDALNNEGEFVFDEIGLRASGAASGEGLLITHVVFHPVQKSLNRKIEVLYTLRIAMC